MYSAISDLIVSSVLHFKCLLNKSVGKKWLESLMPTSARDYHNEVLFSVHLAKNKRLLLTSVSIPNRLLFFAWNLPPNEVILVGQ